MNATRGCIYTFERNGLETLNTIAKFEDFSRIPWSNP